MWVVDILDSSWFMVGIKIPFYDSLHGEVVRNVVVKVHTHALLSRVLMPVAQSYCHVFMTWMIGFINTFFYNHS
jgi:hypothetical protein